MSRCHSAPVANSHHPGCCRWHTPSHPARLRCNAAHPGWLTHPQVLHQGACWLVQGPLEMLSRSKGFEYFLCSNLLSILPVWSRVIEACGRKGITCMTVGAYLLPICWYSSDASQVLMGPAVVMLLMGSRHHCSYFWVKWCTFEAVQSLPWNHMRRFPEISVWFL